MQGYMWKSMWDILIVKSSKIPNRALYMGCVGCQKGEEESSPTWEIVLLGNIIRGTGEANIGPLGMSFIDDYAHPENSAFYIGEKIIVCVCECFNLKPKYPCLSCDVYIL